jgi:hypothetical protein
MSEPAYSVRASLLKCFARSPAHAKFFIDGGFTDETLSMRLGTGGHALLFGTPEVVVYRGGVLKKEKTKKGKKGEPDTIEVIEKEYSDVRNGELWDLFKVEHAGKVILNETEHAKASAMARAVQSHPDADRLLFSPGTVHEQLVEWIYDGRRCTGRLDSLGLRAIADLKCVQDASPRRLPWQARKMGWAAQLAWYSDGVELAGMDARPSYLIAVENSPPFNVQVYEMTLEDMEFGRDQYIAWFDRLIECERDNAWPGYHDGILPLNVLGLPIADEDLADEAEPDDVAA